MGKNSSKQRRQARRERAAQAAGRPTETRFRRRGSAREDRTARDDRGPAEAPSIRAVTVAWLLTILTGLVCEFGAATAWALGAEESAQMMPRALAGLLIFASIIVSSLCLALTIAVWRLRPVPPPWPIVATAAAVVIGPWLLMIARATS